MSDLNTTVIDQIKSQAGSQSVKVSVVAGGRACDVVLTRRQANMLLAGGELVVNPFTGFVRVRRG